MDRRRLCLVIPSLVSGGMEKVISDLANYFSQKEDIETHLICLVKREKFFTLNNKVIFHEPVFVFNTDRRVIDQFKTLFFIRKKLKEIKPESVLSFGETYNSFVILATLLLKCKVFVSDRSKPDKKWGLFHERLRRILYKRTFGIVSQTSFSEGFLIKETGQKNIKVIPNPIDITRFPLLPRENIILSVGRLIPTKNFSLLIEIFSKVNTNDFTLWIVGEGPLRSELEKRAIELNVSDKVILWGNQKNVEWYYSKAKIFAFTSISEGFPNAILEAMAAGLPAISFDCVAGPSDLIEDNVTGFLIPANKTDHYQEKLQKLIDEEELRNTFGTNARNKSLEFDISVIGDRYLNFLLS